MKILLAMMVALAIAAAVSAMWPLLLLLCLLTFLTSIVGLFYKAVRPMATLIMTASVVGMQVSTAGISDPAAWQLRREQLAKLAQEAEAKA